MRALQKTLKQVPDLATSATTATTATSATTATKLSTASGAAPSYSARAWVKFNGIGTIAIAGSGNVSSITDYNVGIYGVNFTTAMDDTSYSCAGIVKDLDSSFNSNVYLALPGPGTGYDTYTTTRCVVVASYPGGTYDIGIINVVFFR